MLSGLISTKASLIKRLWQDRSIGGQSKANGDNDFLSLHIL